MTVTRGLLIGGKDVPAASGRTEEDLDPCSGEVYATGRTRSGRARDRRQSVDVLRRARDARQEPLRPR